MMDFDIAPLTGSADAALFEEDGVVCLRGAFSEWVEPLRDAIDGVLQRPRPTAVNHAEESGGTYFHDTDLWRDTDAIRNAAMLSRAPAMIRQLLGTNGLHFYGDHILVKEPHSPGARTPWHQDESYMRVGGWQIVTVWVALDHVTAETGGLEFVLGSHRWGKVYRPVRFTHGDEFATDRFAESVPDIDADRDRHPTVRFDLEPGDCTVHHIRLLHAAGGNRSTVTRRRALVLRYTGDDVRYTEPNGAARWSNAPFDGPGTPLDPEEFPPVP